MAWTSPRTWVAGELVTAALMNAHVRDNLLILKDPVSDDYLTNEGSDYTTSSTSYVDVDATNLAFTLVTNGGPVVVAFTGVVSHSSTGDTEFDVDMDGARLAGDDGLTTVNTVTTGPPKTAGVSFAFLKSALSAASHIFKLQWRTEAATATLHAGAGTGGRDYHAQFWAREVS